MVNKAPEWRAEANRICLDSSNEILLDNYLRAYTIECEGWGEEARKAEVQCPIFQKEILSRMTRDE